MKIKCAIVLLTFLVSCSKPLEKLGDKEVTLFNNINVYFDMALKNDTVMKLDSIYRLDAGRVLLKKVKLPNYKKQPKVTISAVLTSNGDPWDKAGSLFVIPKNAAVNMYDLEIGKIKKAQFLDSFPGIKPVAIANKNFEPNMELLRFMTPFGVGFFNENEKVKTLKPVYIPKWEKEVRWEQDITHLLPLLEDEVYVGVFIDTWTKQGYNFSAALKFEESTIPNHTKKEQSVIPVLNTIKYGSDQKFYDEFSRNDLEITIPLKEGIKNAKLYYITTGHGGHEKGDEFTQKENVISLDGEVIKKFIPWRDDCASFRRFNPTSGVWTEKATWKGEEIEERIASSDYSRSNWCPGSDVIPEEIPLGDMESGEHVFTFSIPEAQAIDGDKINFWMVSAYIVHD